MPSAGGHVAVVGGGFAGVACAAALAAHGVRVTLVERRASLGGRAWSFPDGPDGEAIDNGQHLFAGAYRQTLELLERLGSRDRLSFQDALSVPLFDLRPGSRPRGTTAAARPQRRAGLLGRLRGLGGFALLGAAARARLWGPLLALRGLGPAPTDDISVEDWLVRCGQRRAARQLFWGPIALAALNQDPRLASSALFGAVLQETLLAGSEAARLAVARVPLSELFAGLAPLVTRAGGAVRTQASCALVETEGGRAAAVRLKSGERLGADAVVLAVPPRALEPLLPPALASDPRFRDLADRLGGSAILSVHLWLDRQVMDGWMLGLLGTEFQFVFCRDAFAERPGRAGTHLVLCRSAADALCDRGPEALAALALEEVRRALPPARAARLERARVVKERDATIAHTVGTLRHRPDGDTPLGGLFLAGDYLRTGLPATIESAVRSGTRTAALCRAYLTLATRPSPSRARSAASRLPPA